jgi:hypothetical protein
MNRVVAQLMDTYDACVLSDCYVDVALVGMRGPRPRSTRFAELNDKISNDIASRIDLAQLRDRFVH